MTDRTFDPNTLLDAYRETFASVHKAQEEGFKAIERLARFQYALAGDYLEAGIAHGHAAFAAIIRFYGNPVQEMLTKYLEQSIGSLLRQQQVMRTEMAKVLESPLAPMADMARQNMELWAKMQASMLSAFTPPDAAATKAPPEEPSKPRSRKRRG